MSGLSGYSYVFDTTSTTTPDTTQDIATVTTVTSGSLSDGNSHYFHIRAVDGVGNWGSAVHSGPYYIDTTAPSVPGTPSTTTPTSDATPTWSWTASTDSGSGLATDAYSVQWCQSSSYTGCDSNTSTSTTNSFTHATSIADGTWYFRVRAADAAANTSAYSESGSAVVDTTPPLTFSLKSPDDDTYTSDKTPTFKWKKTTDATSSLDKYSVLVDGETLIDNIDPNGSDGEVKEDKTKWVKYGTDYIEAHTKGTDSNLASGERSWKVRAFDLVGNRRTTNSRELTVDQKSPNLTLKEVGNNKGLHYTIESDSTALTVTDTAPTFKGSSAPGAKVTVYAGSDDICSGKANGKSSWDCTPKKALSFGSHLIKIVSEDQAGNTTILPKFTLVVSRGLLNLATIVESPGIREIKGESSQVLSPVLPNPNIVHTLKVKLIANNQKPLAGAKVTLFSEPKEAVTDKNGIATFGGVENGEHKLVVNTKGFTGERKIDVSGDSVDVDLTIKLSVANPFMSPLVLTVIGFLVLVIVFLWVKLRSKTRE